MGQTNHRSTQQYTDRAELAKYLSKNFSKAYDEATKSLSKKGRIMSDAKNDASTDVESKVNDFAKDLTTWSEKWLKDKQKAGEKKKDDTKAADKKKKKENEVESIAFSMSNNKDSKSRTPAEQANEVVKGASYVCWSSHMGEKARHVLMKVNGKVSWEPKEAFGDEIGEFEKKWGELMKTHGLKNAKGGDGWSSWDGFHLELPESKMSTSDKQAQACLDEYARSRARKAKARTRSSRKTTRSC